MSTSSDFRFAEETSNEPFIVFRRNEYGGVEVVLKKPVYEAAKGFWEMVKQIAPLGYVVSVDG